MLMLTLASEVRFDPRCSETAIVICFFHSEWELREDRKGECCSINDVVLRVQWRASMQVVTFHRTAMYSECVVKASSFVQVI